MANKKFRRMITGILLSCNIVSFPFCSAYDVLTEAVANQSGSEQLKKLYKLGREIQEAEAEYETEVITIQREIQAFLNKCDEELKQLTAAQQYYTALFAGCDTEKKQQQLKKEFLNTDHMLLDTPLLSDLKKLCLKPRQNWGKQENRLYENLQNAVWDRLKIYLNRTGYDFVAGVANKPMNSDGLIEFSRTHPLTYPVPDLPSSTKPNPSVAERELLNHLHQSALRTLRFDPAKLNWYAVQHPVLDCLSKRLETITNVQTRVTRQIGENMRDLDSLHHELVLKKTCKAFEQSDSPLTKKFTKRPESQIKFKGSTIHPDNLVSVKPNQFCGDLGWINLCTILNRTLTPVDMNEHLLLHFQTPGTVPRSNLTGYFRSSGSFFESCKSVTELLQYPLDKTCVILVGYSSITTTGDLRYNYVYFIYDYLKYGFVKTGDVYDSESKNYRPAYAINFVTNNNNELITAYPLYM